MCDKCILLSHVMHISVRHFHMQRVVGPSQAAMQHLLLQLSLRIYVKIKSSLIYLLIFLAQETFDYHIIRDKAETQCKKVTDFVRNINCATGFIPGPLHLEYRLAFRKAFCKV